MTPAILGGLLLLFLVIWCWGDFHSLRVALVGVILGVIVAGTNGWAYALTHFVIHALLAIGSFVVGLFQ